MAKKIRLMIVDDSLLMRQAIEMYLQDYNIEIVGTAEDGEAAIKLFNKKKPEYVTLDIVMPKLDGFGVLQTILKKRPSTKIMIVTALSDKDTALQAVEMGAKSVIMKPFTPLKLKEAFGRFISEE
jgi:two-component system chemotaxis response regulator CheY